MKVILKLSIIISCCVLSSCQDGAEEYLKAHKREILKVEADSTTMPADGVTSMRISVTLPANADLKLVSFTASSGKFRFSDTAVYSVAATPFEQVLRAEAYLTPGTEVQEKVLVKVSIANIDTVLQLAYTRALADSIYNESTVASIPRGYGSEIPVKTTLSRKVGTPSQRQVVSFSAFTSDNKSIGDFRGISAGGSDQNGVVNSIFVLKDTVYTGPVRIVSRYAANQVYTDTLLVFVTKK